MRHNGRVNSQLEYNRDTVSDKATAPLEQPRQMYHLRSGEEFQPSRGASFDDGAASPASTAVNASNELNTQNSSSKRRESAPSASSPAFFAPPAGPSPHHGFRRTTTTNTMTAGRRISHRSSSAPGIGGDVKDAEQRSSTLAIAEATGLPSPRSRGTGSVARGLASTTNDTEKDGYEGPSRFSSDANRSPGERIENSVFSATVPGTLPSSNGHTVMRTGLSRLSGDRLLQLTDDEIAAVLTGGSTSSTAMEADMRAGYRYPTLGRGTRAGSVPAPAASVSRDASPHALTPRLTRLEPEMTVPSDKNAGVTPELLAPTEPRSRRERRNAKEEARRRRHTSRRSAAAAAAAAGTSTTLPVPPAADEALAATPSSFGWFAGMTAAQQERFERLQEHSDGGHEMARWKMLELMRHWMSAQGTRSSVHAVVRSVLADAGLVKAKEVRGGSETGSSHASSHVSPLAEAVPSIALTASAPKSEVLPAKISPKNQLIAKNAAPGTVDDAASSLPPSPRTGANGSAANGTKTTLPALAAAEAPTATPSSVPDKDRKATDSVVLPAALGASAAAPAVAALSLTDAAGGSQVAEELKVQPRSSRTSSNDAAPSATPVKKEETSMPRPSAPPPSVTATSDAYGSKKNGETTAVAVIPPAFTATPEKQIAPGAQEGNPLSITTAASAEESDVTKEKTATPRPSSVTATPQRSPSEGPLKTCNKSPARLPANNGGSSRSLKVPPARRAATYEEIPRFYFPLGRPSTKEQVITGPLSKKHENPHLKVADGVSIAAPMYDGEESSRLSGSAEALVGAGDEADVPSEGVRGPKVAPMSHLRMVDDRQVAHHIQREFGRLPPVPRHSQKVRLLSGRMRRGSSNQNRANMSYAKQELVYKQQFIYCVQRVCSECFGVPRYFASLVLRLIQWHANRGALDASGDATRPLTRHATSSRAGSSSSLLSHATSGSNGTSAAGELSSVFQVTPQHLKDFYDVHLKGKDFVRRIFDMLILSSHLPSSPAAAVSLAATNAVPAASTAKPESADGTEIGWEALPLRPYLLPQDFIAYIDALLTHHPGLAFLRQTPDFQTKYLDTVVYRIYYELDRYDRGRISYAELVASRLVDAFRQVDVAEDINTVLLFFSYEHFYVLYCRFWELDENRDMLLAPEDLMRYAPEDVMNPVVVQRVFAGIGRRLRCTTPQRIGYEDFVWFCLSEEDKSTTQAIRYWFRVLDLDGDGVLSVCELQEFYDATRNKIAQYVQEGLVTFEDVVCQVFDMLHCSEYRGLHLADLLREPEAAAVALNMLTNVVKFLQFEQRDPLVSHQERLLGGLEQSTWDRFARLEYDRMALEADEEG